MTASRAFDTAQWVPPTPSNVADGITVANVGPPFTTAFAHLVTSPTPGLSIAAGLPAATAAGQTLISGAGPTFAWGTATTSGTLPTPSGQGQILVSDVGPSFNWALKPLPIAGTTMPLMNSSFPQAGTSYNYAASDHSHPTDTSLYPTSNPANYQTAAQVSASITAAAYVLPKATISTLGGIMVDGTTITVDGTGKITATVTAPVGEAPNDGTSYLRNSTAWVNSLDMGTF